MYKRLFTLGLKSPRINTAIPFSISRRQNLCPARTDSERPQALPPSFQVSAKGVLVFAFSCRIQGARSAVSCNKKCARVRHLSGKRVLRSFIANTQPHAIISLQCGGL